MDMQALGFKALEIVAPVFMAILAWAALKLANFIKAKTKNEYLQGALLRLEDAVLTAIKDMQQTVVASLKAANADGKITDDEKKQIKEKVLANLKSHLGEKGLLELAKILGLSDGALDNFLNAKIEAAVLDLRQAAPQ